MQDFCLRFFVILLLVAGALYTVHGENPIQDQSRFFPLLKTTQGKVYTNAIVEKTYSDSIMLSHQSGVDQVPFQSLPPELIKKFRPSPLKAIREHESRMQTNYQNLISQQADEKERLSWKEDELIPLPKTMDMSVYSKNVCELAHVACEWSVRKEFMRQGTSYTPMEDPHVRTSSFFACSPTVQLTSGWMTIVSYRYLNPEGSITRKRARLLLLRNGECYFRELKFCKEDFGKIEKDMDLQNERRMKNH